MRRSGASAAVAKPLLYTGLDTETVDGRVALICTPALACYPKTWGDLWRFLVRAGRDYAVWHVTYDAQAILAMLPRTILAEIRASGRAMYPSGRSDAWRIEFVAGKRLTIWYGRGAGQVRRDLWDVYPYYDSSLDAAADRHLGERKMGIANSWLVDLAPVLKDAKRRAKVERYCKRDADLTERLRELIAVQYRRLGVSPDRAASPASVARRMFASQYRMRDIPLEVQRVFKRTIYGGRSETYQRGNVGRAFAYDIHSAYPSVIRMLVDPRGGRVWPVRAGEEPRAGAMYGAYAVTVKVPPDVAVPPVPVRRGGGIMFPTGVFSTWLSRAELDLLRERNFDHTVRWGMEIMPVGAPRRLFPPGAIEELYALRKSDPALNIALKKTLNSLYGKYCESRTVRVLPRDGPLPRDAIWHARRGAYVVARDIPTANTCYPLAAAILARTRVTLWRAMRLAGRGLVSCMTDAVVSRAPLALDCGPGLGNWGLDRSCAEFVACGTGIYFYRLAGKWRAKRRGIPDARFYDRVKAHPARTVHIPILCARSLAESERTGFTGLNRMESRSRAIDVNLDRSRCWPVDVRSWAALFETRQRSEAWVVSTRDVYRRMRRNREENPLR